MQAGNAPLSSLLSSSILFSATLSYSILFYFYPILFPFYRGYSFILSSLFGVDLTQDDDDNFGTQLSI